MAAGNNKFINGAEADEHFTSLGKFPSKDFPHRSMLKLWPGQYLGVYRRVAGELNPKILTKLRVVDITADGNGLLAKLMDCVTGKLILVRHIPVSVYSNTIAMCFPQRSFFEKSIKMGTGGKLIYNIAVGVWLIQKSRPNWNQDDEDFLDSWTNMSSMFSDEAAYEKACRDLTALALSCIGIINN